MAIKDIVSIASKVLESVGVNCPKGFTESFANELAKQFGGSSVYIRSGLTEEGRMERDERIRSEFNGRNIKQICERYQIKRTRIYEIINRK